MLKCGWILLCSVLGLCAVGCSRLQVLASFVLDLSFISSSPCIFCVGSYMYSSIRSYALRPCRSMSWQGYTQSSCIFGFGSYAWIFCAWHQGLHRFFSFSSSLWTLSHSPIYEDRCICISSVRAPFVLDLICILPLDLMHFARVDPWADKAIHSLVVLWSTTLMWQSMSDAIQMHCKCRHVTLKGWHVYTRMQCGGMQ